MFVDTRPVGARQADSGSRVRIAGTLRGLAPGTLPPDLAAKIAVAEGATDGGRAAYIAEARAALEKSKRKLRAAEHREKVAKAEAAGIGGWGRR